MLLEHLSLLDVRNYAALEFEPQAGLNVFVGANAQGKSNLLEAIGMLGTGRSFRTSRDGEVIRAGADAATISGRASVRGGTVHLACGIVRLGSGARKRYTVNGTPVRYAGYLGRARVVTFVPADLELVAGPPARRRALLNAALSQERPAYYAALARYGSYLEQKGALLRSAQLDLDLLATYDDGLATVGAALMTARRDYARALAVAAERAYGALAADGPLEVAYAPNVEFAHDDAREALAARMVAARSLELARRTPLVGPHRDDLAVRLAGKSLVAFGSQGQQRTAVLALKIGEYGVSTERGGEPPLLLLDDVLSELDRLRQDAFLHAIGGVEQAFVTATAEAERFPGAATYRIELATLERVA